MIPLTQRSCHPCTAQTPKLDGQSATKHLKQLQLHWEINDQEHLEHTFTFSNFSQAMDFANKIAMIAESENHHPDLHVSWGKCRIEIWTHAVDGLTQNDFILAAKCETT